jgi:hypothetical protein
MFFRERTTEWFAPKIPTALAAVLIVTVIGVLYFGIFSENIIERFAQSPPNLIGSK